jgi:hypothetical protein
MSLTLPLDFLFESTLLLRLKAIYGNMTRTRRAQPTSSLTCNSGRYVQVELLVAGLQILAWRCAKKDKDLHPTPP